MNKAVTPTQAALFIAAAAMCLGVVLLGRAIHAHLRQQHPAVWEKFGFPKGDPFWLKPRDEQQAINAQAQLRRFLWRGEFKKLRDHRLEELLRRRRWLATVAIALLLTLFADVFIL